MFQIISIPFGAIKSRSCITATANQLISIPFGAIKSSFSSLFIFSINSISIPFGAIKRVKPEYDIRTDRLFQFLLVRLKV